MYALIYRIPVPKRYDDRDALLEAATSENPKFFLMSDSAPRPRIKKESTHGPCGIYTAPVLLPVLTEVFEEMGVLDSLKDFMSTFGCKFYKLVAKDTVTLVKKFWKVPTHFKGVMPFYSNLELMWDIM